MSSTFYIINNYNVDPSKILELINTDEYIIYLKGNDKMISKSLINSKKIIRTINSGHNLSDYLEFIIEHYSDLPERVGFLKGNIVNRHIEEDVFKKRIKNSGFVSLYSDNKTYEPIYTKSHRIINTYIAQQIAPGFFLEKTNNWYINSREKGRYFPKLEDLYKYITNRSLPKFITFIPGGCMLVPRENILNFKKSFYQKLHEVVTYDFFPVEAYHLERCMLYIFMYQKI